MSYGVWIDAFGATRDPRVRLLCLPFAGAGSTVYRAWVQGLPDVEIAAVALPGRWQRAREPLCRTVSDIVDGVVSSIAPKLDGVPWVFYGHSLGALVGFEVIRELRRRDLPLPAHFVASARDAPQIPIAAEARALHKLGDREFIDAVDARYGGMDPRILANDELLALITPSMKADFEVLGRYVCETEAPLPVPITAVAGESDPLVSEPGLAAWEKQTSETCDVRRYPGGHFYAFDAPRAQLADLSALCEDAARAAG